MVTPENQPLTGLLRKAAGSKIKLLYVFSLLILGTLIIFTVFKPMAAGEQYSEVTRQKLLQTQDEWILQFEISNHEGRDIEYRIDVYPGGEQYHGRFLVKDGGIYTYSHHVNKNQAGNDRITSELYKEDESEPLAQVIYYLPK